MLTLTHTAPFRVVRVRDGLAVGEVGDACVIVWRAPVTRSRFDTQREALDEVIARHPEGCGFLLVIEPTAKPPNDELRRASADMIAARKHALLCIGCVVEGYGLTSAIARSTLSAIVLIAGPQHTPLSVFASARAAATWMVPRLGARDAGALVRAVEAVRAELEPWPPGKT